jgi:signal transduction histidine kinase
VYVVSLCRTTVTGEMATTRPVSVIFRKALMRIMTDDGRGITGGVALARFVTEGHFGLAGMRERAAMIGGRLDVQTAPDYGTVVIFEIPL